MHEVLFSSCPQVPALAMLAASAWSTALAILPDPWQSMLHFMGRLAPSLIARLQQ
jgi:hypothetical protein